MPSHHSSSCAMPSCQTTSGEPETEPHTPKKATSCAPQGPTTPSVSDGSVMRETIFISSEKKTVIREAATGGHAVSSDSPKKALKF